MIRFRIALILSLVSFSATAQDITFEQTLEQLSSDLAVVQSYFVPEGSQLGQTGTSTETGLHYVPKVKVTADLGVVRSGASADAEVIQQLPQGTEAKVVEESNGWLAIELDQPIAGASVGWVNSADATPLSYTFAGLREWTEERVKDAIDKSIKKFAEMKTIYDSNPYVAMTGFSIALGISPSASFNFEFKVSDEASGN